MTLVLGNPLFTGRMTQEPFYKHPDAPNDIYAGMRMFTGKTWHQDVRFTKAEFFTVVTALGVPKMVRIDGYVMEGRATQRQPEPMDDVVHTPARRLVHALDAPPPLPPSTGVP